MKNSLLICAVLAVVSFVCTEATYAGGGKAGGKGGGKLSVDVCNQNSFDDEDGDIRVWLLSENDVVPTTKAEAEEAGGQNTPGQASGTFGGLDAGNYILVAANESRFQGLEPDAGFEAGTDYSALAFTIEEGTKEFSVASGADENSVPVISEGCAPPGGGEDDQGGEDSEGSGDQ